MDWQLLGASFLAVFLSELGDKSQVAAVALGGSSRSPRAVFLGTASALVLASLIGVVLGDQIADYIPPQWLKLAAVAGFVVIGLRLLLQGSDQEDLDLEAPADQSTPEP